MEPKAETAVSTLDELPESTPIFVWRDQLLLLLGAGLDAVRVATAALSAYQLARMFGVPGIEHESILRALSLWHLVGVYLVSAALSLVLGRLRTDRRRSANADCADHTTATDTIEDGRPTRR